MNPENLAVDALRYAEAVGVHHFLSKTRNPLPHGVHWTGTSSLYSHIGADTGISGVYR